MSTYLLPELSLYFPCYNEESNIKKTFSKALPVIKKIAKKWEILLINDGSTDRTLQIINQIASTDPEHVKVINHDRNRGYGAAMKSGMYGSRYEWITFTDADGQFDFSEIEKLVNVQRKTEADLVIGYYLGRKVPKYRIWGTALWQLAVFILFGLKVKDIDCGFKLFRKKVIDSIPPLEAERGPFISSEFLIKAKKYHFKIVEEGVSHFHRIQGEGTGAKLNVIAAGLIDLFRLWFKLSKIGR